MNQSPLDQLPQNEWDAFIYSIIKPFCRYHSKTDLQQEAWIGLLKACDKFDASKGKFTTFAYYYIRGHVLRYISKESNHHSEQDPIELDLKEYYDVETEQDDLKNTILEKVADQKYANLLNEHFVKDKSFRQIAREQGVSHETIATRVNKILDVLKVRLSNENA